MEGGGAGNGFTGTAQTKGTGGDGSAKPLPPCCVKARAAAPESEAKCHATVVSGWFTEPRSRCGKASKVQYYNNPMWPGTCPTTANISIFCLPYEYISNNSLQE